MNKAKVQAKKAGKSKANSNSGISLETGLGLLCAAFAFILYVNTLNHEFAYDDFPTIYGNQITMKGFAGIPELLHTSYWFGLNGEEDWLYRPASMVMFAAEWGLAPNTPALGHFMNVLLYALTGFLLMRFLSHLFKGNNLLLPFAITMIWIAHPIHTEVVANIKSRDEILCVLFSILALDNFLTYSKGLQMPKLMKGCAYYFLALMSKESAITLVVIVPLMIYFFTDAASKNNVRTSLFAIAPFALYMIIRAMVLSNVLNNQDIPLTDNSLIAAHGNFNLEKGTAFYILAMYLKLLIFPHPMSSDYSFNEIPLVSLTNPVSILALVVYFGIGIYALIRLPKKDPVSFAILFFLITIGIIANVLFLTRSTMADRFLYMPSLGFSIALVVLAGRLFKIDFTGNPANMTFSRMLQYNKKFTNLLAVLVLLGTIKTIARNPDWKNDTTIFSADALHAPNSARLHFLYGNHMAQEVKQNKVVGPEAEAYNNIAIDQFKQAIDIHPDHYESYFGMTDILMQRNMVDKAAVYYHTIANRLPNSAIVQYNLGNFYFKTQQNDSAIAALHKATTLDPKMSGAYNSLGSVYFSKGDYQNALANYQKAAEIQPNFADAWKNIGSTYGSQKEYDKAIDAFQMALKFAPNDA
ncbi:MAG: tetratricopeptide repeat protein, partial [Bacteroidota bacterium]